MPDTMVAWIMFAWFVIGGIGGWIVLYLFVRDAWRAWLHHLQHIEETEFQ